MCDIGKYYDYHLYRFPWICGTISTCVWFFCPADLRADVEIESQREKLQTESTTGQCVLNVSTQSELMHKSRQSVWFQKNHMCVSRILRVSFDFIKIVLLYVFGRFPFFPCPVCVFFVCVCILLLCCFQHHIITSPAPITLSYHTHYYHKHMYSNDVVRQLTRYAG